MSRKFEMVRVHDFGGVSGTGLVLEGIEYSNGKVAVAWLGKGAVQAASVAVYDTMDDFLNIHVRSHPSNATEISWEDGTAVT